jgi:PhzF family phenazine biosynthesis protein
MYNKIFILNAFTTNANGGNPTAVYLSKKPMEAGDMQHMAEELYVPVSAFLWPEEEGYAIRYFTCQQEIAACGHATLAAAAVMAEGAFGQTIRFRLASGAMITTFANAGSFSVLYAAKILQPFYAGPSLLEALGIAHRVKAWWSDELETVFIEMPSETSLRGLRPRFRRLAQCNTPAKEVVVTALSENLKYDYVLRSFCPWIGIDEDPVTGSVQAALAPYWIRKLQRQKLAAFQASARGGEIYLETLNNSVCITGHVFFVSEETL